MATLDFAFASVATWASHVPCRRLPSLPGSALTKDLLFENVSGTRVDDLD
jgi:hypothetical protein